MELCATGPRCTICYGRPHYHECLRRIQQYTTSLEALLEGPCRTESMAGANYSQRDGALVSLAGRVVPGKYLPRGLVILIRFARNQLAETPYKIMSLTDIRIFLLMNRPTTTIGHKHEPTYNWPMCSALMWPMRPLALKETLPPALKRNIRFLEVSMERRCCQEPKPTFP